MYVIKMAYLLTCLLLNIGGGTAQPNEAFQAVSVAAVNVSAFINRTLQYSKDYDEILTKTVVHINADKLVLETRPLKTTKLYKRWNDAIIQICFGITRTSTQSVGNVCRI